MEEDAVPEYQEQCSRVCLAIRVVRRPKAVDVIDTIEVLLRFHPGPIHLRMVNGAALIAPALQDWCKGSCAAMGDIPPGPYWEDPSVESFCSQFGDELLNGELFVSLPEARVLAEQQRIGYNTRRLRSALQWCTPLEVLQQWRAA